MRTLNASDPNLSLDEVIEQLAEGWMLDSVSPAEVLANPAFPLWFLEQPKRAQELWVICRMALLELRLLDQCVIVPEETELSLHEQYHAQGRQACGWEAEGSSFDYDFSNRFFGWSPYRDLDLIPSEGQWIGIASGEDWEFSSSTEDEGYRVVWDSSEYVRSLHAGKEEI